MDYSEPQEVVDSLPERLRALRSQHAYTQEQVAAEIGAAVNTYRQWELGNNVPRLGHAMALAKLYGTGIDFLLLGADPSPTSFNETGTRWSLAWSQPSPDQVKAAEFWLELIEGEKTGEIAKRHAVAHGDIEQRLQSLILHDNIHITEVSRNRDLEAQISDVFRQGGPDSLLREVRVAKVGHIDSTLVRFVLLGHLAKRYFVENVRVDNSVGLCGGFAVSRMVYSLQRGECPAVNVYPIAVSPKIESPHVSANSLAGVLAYRHYKMGVKAHELPFFSAEDLTNATSPSAADARDTLDRASEVDFAFMGVGGLDKGALATNIPRLRIELLSMSPQKTQGSAAAEVVGNVLYYLVDRNGTIPDDFRDQNQRLVCSIGLEGLQHIVGSGKRVVIVAIGKDKTAVTRVAVQSQYANVLIIDDVLASGLLEDLRKKGDGINRAA